MSGSIELNIVTGADWAVQLTWVDGTGTPILFSAPTMDIRQELNPRGRLIAQLDESGNLDGSITIPQEGTMILQIPAQVTTSLITGHAFWDIFVTVNNSRVRLAFGTVAISPHVTVPK